jgi:hypothetical protein
MSVKETLDKYLNKLPENHLREMLEYAEFLSWREEREESQRFGKTQFARAYGTNEPEYTNGDLRPEVKA